MQVVMFTCERDAEKASLAVTTIPADWKVVWIVESKDAGISAPPHVEVVVKDFPRGHNLCGIDAVEAITDILFKYSAESGRVVKMDSDCILIDPNFLTRGEVAGMTHQSFLYAVYGLVYALSHKAALRSIDVIKAHKALGYKALGEDYVITGSANYGQVDDARLPIGSFWQSSHDGSSCPAGRKAIHCGSARHASREGPKVANEMRRLIDELGIARRTVLPA